MTEWKNVDNKDDINNLLEEFAGFHDSCIVQLYYETGNYVTKDYAMVFSTPDEYKLHIILQSQWNDLAVDLCCIGVRRMNIVGLQDNYDANIFDSYLDFHHNILPSRYQASSKVIVWADDCNFDVNNIPNVLEEPATSYVIASSLKWKKIDLFKEDPLTK